MSAEQALLQDGTIRALSDIRARYSLSIYQIELFYAVCEQKARNSGLSGIRHKVLVNLYALKSSRIKDLAALVYFLREEGHKCAQIQVHDDVLELLAAFLPEFCATVVSLGPYRRPYITPSITAFIGLKIICHRLFRLCNWRAAPASVIVRGWVDVTASMYRSELLGAQLLLYPFPYGLIRQYRFYRECRQQRLDVRLAGLPYRWSALLKLLSLRPQVEQIVEIEVQAYERYSDELLAQGVQALYTSDEFEVASVALYEHLIASGVKVVNTAHGVGLYAPYVAYSEFRGVNFAQADFYRLRWPALQPVVRQGKNSVLALDEAAQARHLPVAVVLLDQNFMDFNCIAEAQALLRTQALLEAACASHDLALFLKVHPNSKDDTAGERQGNALQRIKQWTDIKGWRPIFVTVNSTAFYDVQGYGPILICNEPSFFPEIYFGEGLLTYTFENLEQRIEALLDENSWHDASKRHAQRERQELL